MINLRNFYQNVFNQGQAQLHPERSGNSSQTFESLIALPPIPPSQTFLSGNAIISSKSQLT